MNGRNQTLKVVKNSYYLSGAERAEGVHWLFKKIARRYDLINDIQSMGSHRIWKRRLLDKALSYRSLREVTNSEPLCVLDLCSGTGDIAIALAQKGFKLFAADFSGEMLAVAKKRSLGIPPSELEWIEADIYDLDIPASSYDIVTCAYGLRNLSDIPLAIKKMFEWLKPGGLVLFLDFGKPKNIFFKPFFYLYLKLVVPVLGFFLCGDAKAYSYILDSLGHYPAQEGVDKLLQEAGFFQTGWEPFAGGTMCLSYATKPSASSYATCDEQLTN